jgi:poly(3-hydroxybutyrate) depolymerase
VDDVAYIGELMDDIETMFCVDTSREYVIGFSNGGMMAEYMGCQANDRFAAIAPFHGQRHRGFSCSPYYEQTMPIMNIYGTRDTELPYNGDPGWGWYYQPVDEVSRTFGDHNGCDRTWNTVSTVSDGIQSWECREYSGCITGSAVRQCSWNGTHNYACPKIDNATGDSICPTASDTNFALEAVWQFFNQFTREEVSQSVMLHAFSTYPIVVLVALSLLKMLFL